MNDLFAPLPEERAIGPVEEAGSNRGHTTKTVIEAWLKEVCQSSKTRDAYESIITDFQKLLQLAGRDLLFSLKNAAGEEIADVEIADVAELFLPMRRDALKHLLKYGTLPESGEELASASQAQRAAAIASFYRFARLRRHVRFDNPMSMVKRPKVEPFRAATALPVEVVKERLAAIGDATPRRRQDRAILILLLVTGRRADEVASLTRGSVEKVGECLRFHFVAKGGKTPVDMLEKNPSTLIERVLLENHDNAFWETPEDAPVWVNLYHKGKKPLGYRGISDICLRWLGTTQVHTTRGTFAATMSGVGAPIRVIRKALGHEDEGLTTDYVEKLQQSLGNAFAKPLEEAFGIDQMI